MAEEGTVNRDFRAIRFAYTNGYRDSHCYSYGDSHANGYGDSDSYLNPHCYADSHADGYFHRTSE